MADLAALETSLEVMTLPDCSDPHTTFRANAERCACWIRLCPETPGVVGLTGLSPEGTEERRTPYDEVYTALPQRGPPSEDLWHRH